MITKMKINMTLKYLNLNIYLILLFTISSGCLQAQDEDLYNLKNSDKYARYLLAGRQYNLAAEEFERLVFLDKHNDEYKNLLITAYYKSGKAGKAINRIRQLYNNDYTRMPESMTGKFLVLLQERDSLPQILHYLDKGINIKNTDKLLFKWSNLMLSKNFVDAKHFLNTHSQELGSLQEVVQINNFALQQKHKSPLLAASLSTVIPGLGKVYTGDYIDAATAFIFVGGNAFQAYRGFKKNGTKSAFGWIFGSIAAGFYIGNIFGSAKAAIRFNNFKFYETKNKVDTYFQHRFF